MTSRPPTDPHQGRDLTPLLAPASIAVIGASPDAAKPGGRVISHLLAFGFTGALYPVNPRYEQICGVPTVQSTAELPLGIDLGIFVIAAEQVVPAFRGACERGLRSGVVLSSGFREAGERGVALEAELASIASEFGVPLLGPNCLGYVDVEGGVAATFTTALDPRRPPNPGPLAFVSQSGAMGASIFGLSQDLGVGLGFFASTGNAADIRLAELFRHVGADDRRTAILGYIEGVDDGRELVDAVRSARAGGHDLALLKVGTTESGQKAAQSHTGAMAGAAVAWDAAIRRSGAVRVTSPRDLLDVGVALAQPARPRGRRIGIVSMSGGAAVMMTDRAVELGLEVNEFDAPTREALARDLPGFTAVANPVDYGGVYGDAGTIARIVETVAESSSIDMVAVFIGLSANLKDVIEPLLADISDRVGKPLLVAWLGGAPESLRTLIQRGVPAYGDPVRVIEMAAALFESTKPLDTNLPLVELPTPLSEHLDAHLRAGSDGMSEREVLELLAANHVPAVRERLATTPAEARSIAVEFGGRVVVKAEAPALLHKSDVGAVVVGVELDDVEAAHATVVSAARRHVADVRGSIVAEMAPDGGVELLVGGRWDPVFGPLVLVGAGGVTSEVAHDTCLELAPVDLDQARRMLASLRLSPLLVGYRGSGRLDIDAAARAIVAVGDVLAAAGGRISELDINPLRVYADGNGCLALDAAIILGEV